VPDIDLANDSACRRSLRRSRARRAGALRRRRGRRSGRSAAGVVLLSLTLAAAGAAAASGGATSTSRSGGSAAGALLRKGSSGPAVAALQRALGIRADGEFGARTRRAVRRFQRRHGLVADGIAGPATLRALGVSSSTAKLRESSARHGSRSVAATLERIADCESGGDPTAVSASGRYRGKYQFSRATWRAVGGEGDPAKASESEQDMRAAILYRRAGTSAWPSCA
jgi:hypothetical protein